MDKVQRLRFSQSVGYSISETGSILTCHDEDDDIVSTSKENLELHIMVRDGFNESV